MILPIVSSHRRTLSREMLYTAVSRARELVVILSDDETLNFAMSRTSRRVQTGLKHLIIAESRNSEPRLDKDIEVSKLYDSF